MASFDDYEMLKILGGGFHSVCYKVKEKKSSELKVLKVVPYTEINGGKEELIANVVKRISFQNESMLIFNDYIVYDETESLYLVTEYCSNGSLHDIIERCIEEGLYLKEEFLWKILYKITFSLKCNSNLSSINIDIKKIYIDSLFNIKFYGFNIEKWQKSQSEMSNPLALILLRLCAINLQIEENTNILNFYSDNMKDIIQYLLKTELKQSLDTILWHPMVSVNKDKIFDSGIFNSINKNTPLTHEININTNPQDKLENLRKKEINLQLRESKLNEFEHHLAKREKKLALLEKQAREKIVQADLYLKRIKNQKYKKKKMKDSEDLDNSCSADYCESIIIPTSNKLNAEYVSKNKFSRSSSERRVKFKGHSPLKAIQNLQCNLKPPNDKCSKPNSDKSYLSKQFDKTSCNSKKSNQNANRKKRFSLVDMFMKKCPVKDVESIENNPVEDFIATQSDSECFKPIIWTEESKRQAFNLLRIMNSESSSLSTDESVKHTKM